MPSHDMVSLGLIIFYLPFLSHQHLYSLHIWDAPHPTPHTHEKLFGQTLIIAP